MTPFFVKGDCMNILNGFNSDLYTGHRVLRVGSYEEFKNLRFPSDCEVIGLNRNPEVKEIYMAQVDNFGNPNFGKYSYEEIPDIPFIPENYVTVEQFNELKEEIRNGFDSLKSSPVTYTNGGTGKSSNSSK